MGFLNILFDCPNGLARISINYWYGVSSCQHTLNREQTTGTAAQYPVTTYSRKPYFPYNLPTLSIPHRYPPPHFPLYQIFARAPGATECHITVFEEGQSICPQSQDPYGLASTRLPGLVFLFQKSHGYRPQSNFDTEL